MAQTPPCWTASSTLGHSGKNPSQALLVELALFWMSQHIAGSSARRYFVPCDKSKNKSNKSNALWSGLPRVTIWSFC